MTAVNPIAQLVADDGSEIVNFLQAGTGAQMRSVQSKLRETITATDFAGVDPTGVSDSTAGLQAFLTAAAGKRARLPAGTYMINQGLVIQANTYLEGDGDVTVIKANPTFIGTNGGTYATQTCQMIRNTNFAASSLTDSDITISGITFDWGSVTISGGGAHCIAMRYVDRVNVINCRSINGENLTALLACRDTFTYGCRVSAASNCGLDHWDASGNCVVAFCTVRNPGSNSQQGIQFTGTGSFFEDLSSVDCLVMGCSVYGVRAATGSASAIISNANDPGSSTYRFRSIGNLIDDCDIGVVFSGVGGQHLSMGDTLRNVTKLPVFLQNDGAGAPNYCRVVDAHLIDCNHLAGNIALLQVSGASHTIKGLKVTNTGAVAYQKLAWLTSSSSDCILEIEAGASGIGGRVQNDGTNNVVVDATLYSDIAALDGAWTAYTPTITATSGSFTSVAGSGRYKQIGKTVLFTARAAITTNGAAAGTLLITLPVTARAANSVFGSGRDSTTGTLCLWFNASTTNAYVLTTGAAYPGADGRSIDISGIYEAA